MTGERCGFWTADGCEGTPHCPPRCTRFVDRDGRPYLILPLEAGRPGTDRESRDGRGRGGTGPGDERESPGSDAEPPEPLVAMYRDFDPAHRSMGLPPTTDATIRRWLERLRERGTNLVAWDGDSIAGHAGYSPSAAEFPEFFVYVHQDYHGRGLGTELTKHAVARAAAADCDGLVLEVAVENDTAISIYRRLGFETVENRGLERRMRLSFDDPIADRVRLAPGARS